MNKQNSFDKYLTVVTKILKYIIIIIIIIIIINVHILIAQNSLYLVSFKYNLHLKIYKDDSFISLSRMEFQEEGPYCLNSKMVTKGPTSALMVHCFSRKIMTVSIFLHMDCVVDRSINN